MVNPDGVVLGNFRTSLGGRDLNRMFTSEEGLLIPEVKAIKTLASNLKQEFRSRLTFFIDFHGHSVRKNVFIYGP
jgi:cytosolic carboxypeptidase protein 2/3